MLIQFCSPCFDLDNKIKSSAYNNVLSFVPLGSINGSVRDVLSLIRFGNSLRYKLNNKGFKMHPCLTPRAYSK